MAEMKATLRLSKRWFHRPAFIVIRIMFRVGILTDVDKAVAWTVKHTMRAELV